MFPLQTLFLFSCTNILTRLKIVKEREGAAGRHDLRHEENVATLFSGFGDSPDGRDRSTLPPRRQARIAKQRRGALEKGGCKKSPRPPAFFEPEFVSSCYSVYFWSVLYHSDHMRKILLLFALIGCSATLRAQHLGIKNNVIADALLSPNLALEFGLGKQTTLELYASYNPFETNKERKFKHWLAQPELRYWPCERFNGYFLGLHAVVGEFNAAAWKLPGGLLSFLDDKRYEGLLYGAGVSLGHQWILGKRWNIEAAVGAGYTKIDYDRFNCEECSPRINSDSYHYFGLTRTVVSIVYFLR